MLQVLQRIAFHSMMVECRKRLILMSAFRGRVVAGFKVEEVLDRTVHRNLAMNGFALN